MLTLLRTMGGLAAVLGLLAFALWTVRRFDLRLPGRVAVRGAGRRLELVERTSLDSRRSVALLRRDGREHLILLSPEGNLVLETSIMRDEIDAASQAERERAEAEAMALSKAEMEALRESFTAFVDRTRTGVREKLDGAVTAAGNVLRLAHPSSADAAPTSAADDRESEPSESFGKLVDLAGPEPRRPVKAVPAASGWLPHSRLIGKLHATALLERIRVLAVRGGTIARQSGARLSTGLARVAVTAGQMVERTRARIAGPALQSGPVSRIGSLSAVASAPPQSGSTAQPHPVPPKAAVRSPRKHAAKQPKTAGRARG